MSEENENSSSSSDSGSGIFSSIISYVLGTLIIAILASFLCEGFVIAKVNDNGDDATGIGWYKMNKKEFIATNIVTGKESAGLAVLCALQKGSYSQKFGNFVICLAP